MCGIAGYLYFDREHIANEHLLHTMVKSMLHRGPDDEGYFVDGQAGLGMCRLSIIDLASGHQPMVSDDGNVVVVQNGEIYNYLELREELMAQGCRLRTDSDTEVLLHMYQRYGRDFLERLNGMFSIALFDRSSRTLILARDRAGKKPLYIFQDKDKILFASEIKCLLQAGVQPELDEQSLHHFLSFNFVPLPRTIFRGVSHLMPAHALTCSEGVCDVRRYWNVPTEPELEWNSKTLTNAIEEVFLDAVRIRLRADVPVGIFLSGGLDSSAVAWASSGISGKPIHSFSAGFEDARFDESADARSVADRFGLQHHAMAMDHSLLSRWPQTIWHCDQPHGDTSFLPMNALSEKAAGFVKVVLTGEGCDEIFGGYDWYQAPGYVDDISLERFDTNSVFSSTDKSHLYEHSFLQKSAEWDSFALIQEVYAKSGRLDMLNRLLYVDLNLLLPGNNLVKSDRMGMAHSIEPRSPFLDHRLITLAFSVPSALKISGGVTKACFREMISRHLAPDTAMKKKKMFSLPFQDWIRTTGADWVRELLLGRRTLARGFFDPIVLRRVLEEHQAGKSNNIRKIRGLMALEIWCRVFLDGNWRNQPSPETIGLPRLKV